MDLPLGAVVGSTRVALQVVSQRRRPLLDVYSSLRNRARPPETYTSQLRSGKEEEITVRGYDLFVDFILINIGGARAENVKLGLDGDFTLFHGKKKLSSIGPFKGAVIPQLAPAQQFRLFQIDAHDLEARDKDGTVAGLVQEGFTVSITYNGPRTVLSKLRRRRYKASFTFSPAVYDGALVPPAEYQ